MVRSGAVLLALVLAAVLGAWWPHGDQRAPRTGFDAAVSGTVEALLTGRASFGLTGDPAEPARGLAVELEALDEDGTLLLQWTHPALPRPGIYAIRGDSGAALHALYIAGPAAAPLGVFRARQGTVRIRHASAALLTGTFELIAIGSLAADSTRAPAGVRVSGSFVATTVSP